MSAGTTQDVRTAARVDVGRPRSLDDTIERGANRLLELQCQGGWWAGELESNVTITAQHLFFLEFLRLRDAETTERVRAELLARQRDDGLWAIYEGAEPDLNATVEAYAAYRVGYHRGLDRLRQNGWRGSGYVRWTHEPNRGFLRALDGLRRMAAEIGEDDERDRCHTFLLQLDPDWDPALVES